MIYGAAAGDELAVERSETHWASKRNALITRANGIIEAVRSQHDSAPASAYIKASAVSVPPYYITGAPCAAIAGALAKSLNVPEAALPQVIAWGTFAQQLVIGYSVTAYVYARDQRAQFTATGDGEGPLVFGKVAKYALTALLKVAPLEILYGSGKTHMHELLMRGGMGKEASSLAADAVLVPLWLGLMAPIGFGYGLFENRHRSKAASERIEE